MLMFRSSAISLLVRPSEIAAAIWRILFVMFIDVLMVRAAKPSATPLLAVLCWLWC
jgi:hypothetical protein